MGTVVQSGEDLERLLAQTGEELKLLLDTGHAAMADMDPGAVAARHAGRIRHLHLKNVRPPVAREAIEKDRSFLDAVRAGVFTVPGDAEGGVDFMPVLRAVAGGYEGWLVIEAEQDPRVREPRRTSPWGSRRCGRWRGKPGSGAGMSGPAGLDIGERSVGGHLSPGCRPWERVHPARSGPKVRGRRPVARQSTKRCGRGARVPGTHGFPAFAGMNQGGRDAGAPRTLHPAVAGHREDG